MKTTGKTWVEGTYAKSSVKTWIRVSPQQAFEYVSDLPRHREWALDEISVTPVAPGSIKLGSRFKSVGKQVGKEWPSDLEVTVYEPVTRFEFTATGGPLDVPEGDPHRHMFLFRPENGGTTLELNRTDPKPPNWPGWVMRIFGPLIIKATLNKRVQTVEKLRIQLEKQAA